jgi:hypothetical protein
VYDWQAVTSVWASLFLFAVSIHWVGVAAIGRFGEQLTLDRLLLNAAATPTSLVILTSGFVGSLWLLLYTQGMLVASGMADLDMADASYATQVARSMVTVASLGLAIVCSAKIATGRAYAFPACCLLVVGLFAFLNGRRNLAEVGAIFTFSMLAASPSLLKSWKFWGSLGIAAVLVLRVAGPFFVALREEFWHKDIAKAGAQGLWLAIPSAVDNMDWIVDSGRYERQSIERANILNFNYGIAERQTYSRSDSFMLGEATANNLIWVVPRFLYPDKINQLRPEPTVQAFFGMPEHDEGSNWPAYGLADFGPPGGIIVGLIFGAFLVVGQRAATKAMFTGAHLAGAFLLAACFHSLMMVDTGPDATLQAFRDATLLALPAVGLRMLER